MDDLHQAISLLRAGHRTEAQMLFQQLIRADRGNEAAWPWYVDTLSTNVERVEALKWCLRFNPNSGATLRAIELFSQRESKLQADNIADKPPISESSLLTVGATS